MAIPTGSLSRRARCQDVPGAASRNSESNSSGVRPEIELGTIERAGVRGQEQIAARRRKGRLFDFELE